MSRQPSQPTLKSELGLIVGFLAIIFAVPAVQIGVELYRGERVQFTDLFRHAPTEKNLRQFERTLEEQSWIRQALRPEVQRLLLRALGDPGATAIMGRNGWLFYRSDVRYLIEPMRLETGDPDSTWVEPPDGTTTRDSVVCAIVRFRDQLKQRGIDLLVVPVPGKPSVCPDMLTCHAAQPRSQLRSPTLALLADLQSQGVRTVDLFALFEQVRQEGSVGGTLCLARDTHWTPLGAQLAARAVAKKVQQLGWAPAECRRFLVKGVRLHRFSDIAEMMQIPGSQESFPSEPVECDQVFEVINDRPGLIVPASGERPGTHRDPARQSSILLLGDSFCRIYQIAEPQSLGSMAAEAAASPSGEKPAEKGAKRFLPGSAGLISHLALALGAPVDFIVSDGGAATDVRKRLSTNAEILEGKRLVIWEFAERDIQLGKAGWEDVPLPANLE